MKKLVTGCFGNIYYATLLKNGVMSDKDRVELTDDALTAVLYHLTSQSGFEENGFAGYEYPQKNSDKLTTLCAFTNDSHVCVSKKVYEELLEYKHMYEDLCK